MIRGWLTEPVRTPLLRSKSHPAKTRSLYDQAINHGMEGNHTESLRTLSVTDTSVANSITLTYNWVGVNFHTSFAGYSELIAVRSYHALPSIQTTEANNLGNPPPTIRSLFCKIVSTHGFPRNPNTPLLSVSLFFLKFIELLGTHLITHICQWSWIIQHY